MYRWSVCTGIPMDKPTGYLLVPGLMSCPTSCAHFAQFPSTSLSIPWILMSCVMAISVKKRMYAVLGRMYAVVIVKQIYVSGWQMRCGKVSPLTNGVGRLFSSILHCWYQSMDGRPITYWKLYKSRAQLFVVRVKQLLTQHSVGPCRVAIRTCI